MYLTQLDKDLDNSMFDDMLEMARRECTSSRSRENNFSFNIDKDDENTKFIISESEKYLLGADRKKFEFDQEIINVDLKDVRLEEAIQTSITASEGMNIYGVLFHIDGEIYNPFHPMVALSMLSNFADRVFDEVKILIYVSKYAISPSSDYDTLFNALVELSLTHKPEETVSATRDVDYDNHTFNIASETKAGTKANNVLIPVQTITRGYFSPFYGAVLANRIENTATILTPHISGNIDFKDHLNEGYLSGNYICTGEEDSRTITGLETLNHNNLSSSYTQDVVIDHSELYGISAFRYTIRMYKNIFGSPNIEPVEVKEVEYDCSTLLEYKIGHGNGRSFLEVKKEYDEKTNRKDIL